MVNNYDELHNKTLNIKDGSNILAEVKHTTSLISPDFDFSRFDQAFQDVERLFCGKYEGYRAGNAPYHDFSHTLLVLLAMIRLMHGASLQEIFFTDKKLNMGLIAALMHDTGYVQDAENYPSPGEKHPLTHVDRSIQFVQNYYAGDDYFAAEMKNIQDILICTDVHAMVADVAFQSRDIALLGKMLGTADLLGQTADRLYLEKLIQLYSEFEGKSVPDFDSEIDLLRKTITFHKWTKTRFENEFDNVNRFMIDHFKSRWNIDVNVYEESIDKNINYLKFVLKSSQRNIYHSLRRKAISIQ